VEDRWAIAFNDLLWFIGWITFALLPLLLIMETARKIRSRDRLATLGEAKSWR